MKKIYCLLLTLAIASCGKTPINGKLDGMWYLTDIDYIDSISSNVKEKQIYYSVQLNLISLRSSKSYIEYLGRFDKSEDSLVIRDFRIKEEENQLATTEELKAFGLNSTTTRFAVEKLDRNKMILKSNYARLYFKKI